MVCPPLPQVSVWPGLWPSLRQPDGTRILCGLSTSVPSVCVARFVAVTQTIRWDEDPLWSVHLCPKCLCGQVCGRHSDNQMGRGSFVVCPPLSLVSVWSGLWPSLRPSDGTRTLYGLSTSVPSVCVARFVAVTQTIRWDEDPLWSVHLCP